MGPTSVLNSLKFNCQNNLISVSFKYTWINTIISTLCMIAYVGLCLEIRNTDFWYGGGAGVSALMVETNLENVKNPYPVGFLHVIILHLFSILTSILIQFIDKFKQSCCNCMVTHCLPIRKRTFLDPQNPDILIEHYGHDEKTNDCQNQIDQRNCAWYVNRYIFAVSILLIILSFGTYFAIVGIATGNGLFNSAL